jgi:hypothetical protein
MSHRPQTALVDGRVVVVCACGDENCPWLTADDFDADELGLDPEEEYD